MTYRFQDGLGMKNPRSAVFLPYDWTSPNQSKIITAVADLKRLVDERNLSLKEAAKFMLEPVAKDQAPSVTNKVKTILQGIILIKKSFAKQII